MAAIRQTADEGVRALIDRWVAAFRAKDLDGMMSCYAPDILAFDAITALQFKGAEAYRKQCEAAFSYMPGRISYEVRDLQVTAHDDIAFGHYLARCGATGRNGEENAGWLRVTICCRRTEGRWQIAHEHFSAPFDPESFKILDLQP